MASKTYLLLVLAFATILLISSQVLASKDLASNHDTKDAGEVDAKYGNGGYYNGGGRGGGYYNGGGRGGGYNNGGGYKNGGGYGRGGGNCKYGCCGGGRYYNGCKCCTTFAEAAAYKQAHDAQTHN